MRAPSTFRLALSGLRAVVWGPVAAIAGLILEVAGLTLDLALHAADPELAGHEGPLSLSNPAHALFAGGLMLTLTGVAGMVLSPPARRRRSLASVLLALAVLPPGAALLASPRSAATNGAHAEAEHMQPPPQVTWSGLVQAERKLRAARAATSKYRDAARAERDGYRQVTGVVLYDGAHFVNQRWLDAGGADPAHPPVLLYDQGTQQLELVGVAWMVPRRAGRPPPRAFGSLAVWHAHDFHRPCLTLRRSGHPVTTHSSRQRCRAAGSVYIPARFWMLHAWVFRAGREGVFGLTNDTVPQAPAFEGAVAPASS